MFNVTVIARRVFSLSVLIAGSTLVMCSCSLTSTTGGNQNENANSNGNDNGEWTPLVNLQVTEDADVEAFDTIMSELESRGIIATIIIDEYMALEGYESLRAADEREFEIMTYGRPDEPEDEVVTLEMLSYED